ncbi:hypothetical protein [uncultured Phascolarctobacterium sp.]|uniref:hypothetical protein n=1 Tax=uncultured Phascolarctobacterium sp. TaxID=512296 RepID=UPI0025E42796|nr:hypothetical protein [uncultured Phascolarctobacterium sp.]
MGIEIVGYCEKYKKGVLDCFKRHYQWMSTVSDKELEEWTRPFLNYQWINKIVPEEFPFRYGQVMLNNDKVIGYLGYVYSKRQINGILYNYVTCTTWAIDEKYRIYLFKVFKQITQDVDVIADFTSRESVKEVLMKIFKFKCFDNQVFKFYPIPFLKKNNIKYRAVTTDSQLTDPIIKQEYRDHVQYNVKCLICNYSASSNTFYIFYKVIIRETGFLGKVRWIKILKVTNGSLFAKNANEIIWYLQKQEYAFLESDARFFENQKVNHLAFVVRPIHRLVLNKMQNELKPDSLYSEICMLEPHL